MANGETSKPWDFTHSDRALGCGWKPPTPACKIFPSPENETLEVVKRWTSANRSQAEAAHLRGWHGADKASRFPRHHPWHLQPGTGLWSLSDFLIFSIHGSSGGEEDLICALCESCDFLAGRTAIFSSLDLSDLIDNRACSCLLEVIKILLGVSKRTRCVSGGLRHLNRLNCCQTQKILYCVKQSSVFSCKCSLVLDALGSVKLLIVLVS